MEETQTYTPVSAFENVFVEDIRAALSNRLNDVSMNISEITAEGKYRVKIVAYSISGLVLQEIEPVIKKHKLLWYVMNHSYQGSEIRMVLFTEADVLT